MSNELIEIPDARERKEALDPERSFIVQAPAGSGKTELLMRRYLALLATVSSPEQVLAITFTRKAAGEMRSRIIEALRRAASGVVSKDEFEEARLGLARAVLERDQKEGWEILRNPSRLRVQTIDAFSHGVVGQIPLLSRLGGNPSVSTAPRELYTEAARRTVLKADEKGSAGECVRRALRRLDNNAGALVKRLVSMLEKRDQWLRHVRPSATATSATDAELRVLVEGSLKNLVEAALQRAAEAAPPKLLDDMVGAAAYAGSNLAAARSPSPASALSGIEALPSPTMEGLDGWKGLCALLLTKSGELRRPGGVKVTLGFPADKTPEALREKVHFKGLLEALALDALNKEEAFVDALAEVAGLPTPSYSDAQWDVLSSLLGLLPVAEEELLRLFTEDGTVDFQALSLGALEALGTEARPTDLLLSMDLRLRHILVDEYQDISRTQLELVKALTLGWERGDGRTLFLVGDPMQSIYLFREAEVGLFIEARARGVSGIELESLTLRSNFRSGPALVNWVNRCFEDAFPMEEDVFMGSVRYEPFVSAYGEADETAGRARKCVSDTKDVSVTLFDGRSEAHDLAEARGVVEAVREALKKGSNGSGETVAILVSSRTHLEAIIRRLKAERVRFRAEEIDPLSERPVVRDLLSLLSALEHPFDRTAWLSILRAPWCGLKTSDLLTLCRGDDASPIKALIEERADEFGTDASQRLSRVAGILEKASKAWGRTLPRSVLEAAWTELGGPVCYDDPDSMGDAEAFFTLVDEVGEVGPIGDGGGDGTHLYTGNISERVKGLYSTGLYSGHDPGAEGSALVEVMTIHKAKGLEFDHVIVPGLGRALAKDKKELVLWMERGEELLLAPIALTEGESDSVEEGRRYGYLAGLKARKKALEMTRLLYVAMTRARKRLYLFGHVNRPGEGGKGGGGTEDVKAPPGSLLAGVCGPFKGRGKAVASGHFSGPFGEVTLVKEKVAGEGVAPSAPAPGPGEVFRGGPKRLRSGWEPPRPAPAALPPELTIQAPTTTLQGKVAESLEPVFFWAGAEARLKGTVVHAYLCQVASKGLSSWGGDGADGRFMDKEGAMDKEVAMDKGAMDKRIEGELPRMRRLLLELGLGSDSAERAAVECAGIIRKTLLDRRGRWLLSPHREGGSELAMTGVITGGGDGGGSKVVRVIIDRTFVEDNGVEETGVEDNGAGGKGIRWVVDYKTSSHEGGSLDAFLASERQRYAPQLERYSAVLRSGGEVREIRHGLYFPALSEWIEW